MRPLYIQWVQYSTFNVLSKILKIIIADADEKDISMKTGTAGNTTIFSNLTTYEKLNPDPASLLNRHRSGSEVLMAKKLQKLKYFI